MPGVESGTEVCIMARITIEDCLKKVPSRFVLVHLAAQRGRLLMKGAPTYVKTDNKPIVTALREVAAGYVKAVQSKKDGKKA